MADFAEHYTQCCTNIEFLLHVNKTQLERFDWQVTIAFYASVHLVNAHIAKTVNQHYRSHRHVEEALSPYIPLNPSMLEEEVFISYLALRGLSRRSRYLCSEKGVDDVKAHFTSEKHFAKAIRNLDLILKYFHATHKCKFSPYNINCARIKGENLNFFKAI